MKRVKIFSVCLLFKNQCLLGLVLKISFVRMALDIVWFREIHLWGWQRRDCLYYYYYYLSTMGTLVYITLIYSTDALVVERSFCNDKDRVIFFVSIITDEKVIFKIMKYPYSVIITEGNVISRIMKYHYSQIWHNRRVTNNITNRNIIRSLTM